MNKLPRETAWALLTEYTQTPALQKHALAVEAAMAHFARLAGEDEEVWGVAGLLHDTGFLIVASLIVVGQILIVSFGGEVFRVVPLSLRDWLIVIASTSIVLWVGELIRLIVNRREKR